MTQLFKVGQKVRIKNVNQNDPCYIPTDRDLKHAKRGDYVPEAMRMRRFIGKLGTGTAVTSSGPRIRRQLGSLGRRVSTSASSTPASTCTMKEAPES